MYVCVSEKVARGAIYRRAAPHGVASGPTVGLEALDSLDVVGVDVQGRGGEGGDGGEVARKIRHEALESQFRLE